MANIILQHEGTTYRTLGYPSRVTSPSLILEGDGTTLYTPLFAVDSGAEGRDGNYYYKCCPLAVKDGGTTYRAAYARRYASSVSGTISTTISHSGKTGSTTQIVQRTVTVSASCGFGQPYHLSTGDQTWWYGVTFLSTPSIYNGNSSYCAVGAGLDHANISPTFTWQFLVSQGMSAATWTVSATGPVNVSQTITTYPSETISATASGDFAYGVTYPSAPTLSVTDGDVSVSNNSDNASFNVSKTLTGTVEYGESATLSQAFSVSFNGAA